MTSSASPRAGCRKTQPAATVFLLKREPRAPLKLSRIARDSTHGEAGRYQVAARVLIIDGVQQVVGFEKQIHARAAAAEHHLLHEAHVDQAIAAGLRELIHRDRLPAARD